MFSFYKFYNQEIEKYFLLWKVKIISQFSYVWMSEWEIDRWDHWCGQILLYFVKFLVMMMDRNRVMVLNDNNRSNQLLTKLPVNLIKRDLFYFYKRIFIIFRLIYLNELKMFLGKLYMIENIVVALHLTELNRKIISLNTFFLFCRYNSLLW